MTKILAAVAAALFAFATFSARAQEQAGLPSSLIGFTLAKYVREGDGKIAGVWWSSIAAPCMPQSKPPPGVAYDTRTVLRFIANATCNGETEYFMLRRDHPLVIADGACAFDYTTAGGMLGGLFQEVPQKNLSPDALAAAKKAEPDLRHFFGTKQMGGVVALLGWTERPAAPSAAVAEQGLLAAMDRLRAAGQANYRVEADAPWAVLDVRDYQDGGKTRRDVGMNVIDDKACVFSIKLSRLRDPGDEGVWSAFDNEFARIRRVIGNYESNKPWVVSGAK